MTPEMRNRSTESYEAFTARTNPSVIVDQYELLLEDLFLIRNPRFKFEKEYSSEFARFKESYCAGRSLTECGEWFYFPWNKTLIHYLPESEHLELRSARNRNIITNEEQQLLYGLRVGFAGLSVGSHGVMTFALMGGARCMHIADPDVVSPSNLNRIRLDFLSVGKSKCALVSEFVYQLNPYTELTAFAEGVTEANMDAFFSGIDVLVEETDNLEMKIRLRLEARKRSIPVIMATDNGDNIIFETERFDKDNTTALFNGAIGEITLEEFKSFPPQELPRLATKIAGPQFVTERMMQSLPEVGKSIYSWPQLADAATLSGVAIAYALKRLALKQDLVTHKSEINLDALFDPHYQDHANEREAARRAFLSGMGL